MCRRIGQWVYDLQLLDDRAGPPMRDDERQRIFMLRADVNEMNVDTVNLGHEHGQRVQSRLHFAPVVIGSPVADDFLEFPELIALRAITDRFFVRPAGRCDASAEIDELLVRYVYPEGTNCIGCGRSHQL
jgi:hypothetical protein